jgi:putative ABC transport system permease protein
MIRNYFTVALRNLRKYKVFSCIKVFGLATGVAACILIYLYVRDELSFDKFHKNGDSLYRVVQATHDKNTGKETELGPFLPPPVGPQLQQDFPEIKHQSRFTSAAAVVRVEDKIFSESVTLADSPFFEMFTFPLVFGSPSSALPNDQSAVLTRSLARKYFAEENPVGKRMSLSFGDVRKDYVVTAVAEDVPPNSSILFNMIIPFDNLPLVVNEPNILRAWNRWYCPVFVQLNPGLSAGPMQTRLDLFTRQYFGAGAPGNVAREPFTFGLQKVGDIRFDTRVAGTRGLTPSYFLSAIALAILLIACVNFMNLSIGLSSTRAKEVALRKVVGAQKKQIIGQMTTEALLIGLLAVLIGIMIAELLLPSFNALSAKQLPSLFAFKGANILALLAIAVIAGLAAGGYPAFVLSAFRPVDIMKGRWTVGGKTALTRGLVIFQFVLSLVLGISAITLGRQVSYLENKDLGYVSDGLVVLSTLENELQPSERVSRLFRDEIQSHSTIRGATASSREFGLFLPSVSLKVQGKEIRYRVNRVDPGFLSTMKIKLVQGRDFSPNATADNDAVIINQKFLEALGPGYRLGDPLGDAAQGFPSGSRVVGVMENSHVRSLRSEVEPLLLYVGKGRSPNRDTFGFLFVRIGSDDVKETMDFLERTWKKIQPEKPFSYFFQDDALAGLYSNEQRWSAIVRYATAISLVLACLGIFGLTALTLSRRKKEIGVRKVLGASLEGIVFLGIKEFLVLIAVANVISWPIVSVIMKNVLRRYPYHVGLGFPYFLLAGAVSIFLAVLTILYLSLKAARVNPVESLKYE